MSWAGLSEPIEMLLPRNGSGFVCAENVTDAAYSTDCTACARAESRYSEAFTPVKCRHLVFEDAPLLRSGK